MKAAICVGSLALALLLPASAAAAGAPTPHCAPGPENCVGWYRTDVTVTWTWDTGGAPQSCLFTTITVDTSPTTPNKVTCTVAFGGLNYTTEVTIQRDATPPQVTGSAPSRSADVNGWYNHPLSVAYSGADATSGIASCSNPSYGGADGATLAVSGTCTDAAGNTSAPVSFAFKYDATAPTVTAAPDRKPDGKGWYRKPLTVSFAGTDLTSGVASCTAPIRYSGPDQEKAAVVGSCRDAAGNAAEIGHTFAYDATAPKLASVTAQLSKGTARIGWQRAQDVVRVELVRTPGVNGAKATIVYQGNGAAFVDRTVKAGIRYRYDVTVADIAGNESTKAVTAALGQSALHSPAAGSVVRKPPLLQWQRVAGAKFYNVQLYRNGVKVLSTWPRRAKLQLGRSWRYGGKQQRLVPGLYKWYVWGAKGTLERPTYGPVLGSSTFVVKR